MPRDRIPSRRLHKQSGQAVVTLNGRDILLGKFSSPESVAEYNRVIAEWLSSGRTLVTETAERTIGQLIVGYLGHCKTFYAGPDGTPGLEVENIKRALIPLRRLYSHLPANEFGPLKLKTVRDEMVRLGWARSQVNRNLSRVKALFKWATENELLPASIFHGLQAVSGLRRGKGGAKESEPVKPVPEAHVDAILPHVSGPVRAMIQVQLLTGARAGEIVIMRGVDLDATGTLWTYKPSKHKTEHHGHARTIYIGPQAQDVLRPFLRPDVNAYLFNPADAVEERRALRAASRKTPLSCGNRAGTNVKRHPKREPTDRYCVAAYRRAISRACDVAGVPNWSPHQLRHTAATKLRKEFGLEAAQVILGHKHLKVTEIYAEQNVESAQKIMRIVG